MGIVYEATRQGDGERVALKMMNHQLVYRPRGDSPLSRRGERVAVLGS